MTETMPGCLTADEKAAEEVGNFLQESDFGDGDGKNQRARALEELEKQGVENTRSYNEALVDFMEKYFNIGAGTADATGTSSTTQRFQQRADFIPGTLKKGSSPLDVRDWLEWFWFWLVTDMGEHAAKNSAVVEFRFKVH